MAARPCDPTDKPHDMEHDTLRADIGFSSPYDVVVLCGTRDRGELCLHRPKCIDVRGRLDPTTVVQLGATPAQREKSAAH